MSLNIIHIVRFPQIGGSEILIKNIINANKDKNVSHSLLYTRHGPLVDLINDSKKSNLIFCKFTNPLIFIIRLHKIFKNRKVDIIHTHQPIDSIYAFFATRGLKVKIIRTYHGYEGINKKKPGFSIKRKILYFLINRTVSLNLFVSKDLLKYYRIYNSGQYQSTQKVLYNGADIERLGVVKEASIRTELGIGPEKILLGMIGGFNTKVRDQYTVCRAYKTVLEIYPESHFIFIGKKGGSHPEIYNECYMFCKLNNMLPNVHFIGERNNSSGILRELNIYVHSSNNDTFGIALVEALLAGVPAIASDIPPFREVSDNGKLISLFEKGNVSDLYNSIIKEIKNINNLNTKNRINEAKDFAEKNFSIQTHLQNLHKLYYECLK